MNGHELGTLSVRDTRSPKIPLEEISDLRQDRFMLLVQDPCRSSGGMGTLSL